MSYRPGDYLAICDICGLRGYASEMQLNWKKQFVHSTTCFEEKHEQYIPPKPLGESQKVPVSRPEQTDTFITDKITADDL